MPIKYTSNEVLLNNNLDKSFQNILKPLNLLHSLVFLNKYRIRDNFITSNCLFTTIVSFCVVMVLIGMHCYFTTVNLVHSISSNIPVLYIYHGYDLVVYPIFLFCNYIINVYYSNNNVKLAIKLHEADKFTNFSKNNFSFVVWNWLFLLLFFSYSVTYNIYCFYVQVFTIYFIVSYSVSINLIYASRIMSLMTKNVYLWIELLKFEFQKIKEDGSDCAQNYKKIFKCYMDISEAFVFYKKTFEFLVRIYILYLFLNTK